MLLNISLVTLLLVCSLAQNITNDGDDGKLTYFYSLLCFCSANVSPEMILVTILVTGVIAQVHFAGPGNRHNSVV